jgi:ferredoxin-NADP reductase
MNLKLIDKKQEASDVITFIFEPENPVSWKAGQFMRYQLNNPDSDQRGESRFFTISSAPFEKNIQITTRFAGDKGSSFKKDLKNLQIGDTLEGYGPSGSFTLNYPEEPYILIAGGIGITPFRSMLVQLNHDKTPFNIKLLYANKTDEVVFKEELESLKPNNPNFSIDYFIGDHKLDKQSLQPYTRQRRGSLASPAKPGGPKRAATYNIQHTYYLSGPEPMIQTLEKILVELGIPEDNIKHDYFPGYSGI